jgi:hypothetical protein
MSDLPIDAEPVDEPSTAAQKRSGPSRLALVITVLVVWLAVVQVLDDGEDDVPAAAAPSAQPVEPPQLGGASQPGLQLEADVVDPDWGLRYEEDLSRLDQLRWIDLVEVHAEGHERAYRGKLTLVFGDGVKEAWPIVDGGVTVGPRPGQVAALLESGVLSVQFKRHLPVEHDFSWLKRSSAPELLASEARPDGAIVTVRNPTITARTVRVRAGWRDDDGWLRGEPSASAMVDLQMAPGETRVVTLEHASSDRGELAEPMARTIIDPQTSP